MTKTTNIFTADGFMATILDDDGMALCWAFILKYANRCWISGLTTRMGYQRKGLATKLVRHILAVPTTIGHGHIYVSIDQFARGMTNEQLISWYTSLGFRDCNNEFDDTKNFYMKFAPKSTH